MAIKAVLFCRVSSNKQDYNRQISDLTPLALADGYTDDEIAIISHKESATKNNTQNRKTISDLKELIANNHVENVYTSEVSRLARRWDCLYDILALLEEKKICLVIQNPMLVRTIENGKPNPISQVIISFMSYLAVSESEVKLERMKSGLKEKIADGRICASKIIFGYKRSSTNHALINDEEAKVVYDIYNRYLNGDSIGMIWAEYKHTNYFGHPADATGVRRIQKILKDKTYIGHNPHYKYPAIISEELFNGVQDRLASKVICRSKQKCKHVYYCQGLLKYKDRTLTPSIYKLAYNLKNQYTKESISININVIDYLAFNNACEALSIMQQTTTKERLQNASERLNLTIKKIDGIKDDIKANETETDRINMMFQKGRYDMDKWEYETSRLEGELDYLLKEQEQLNQTKIELEAILQPAENGHMEGLKSYYNYLDISDDLERQKLIKQAIKSIELSKSDKGIEIRFNYIDESLNHDDYYLYVVRGWQKSLYHCFDGVYENLTNTWIDHIKKETK